MGEVGGGGGGGLKFKILETKNYESKLEFPWGEGGAKQKNFSWWGGGGGMDIFWNCTIYQTMKEFCYLIKSRVTQQLATKLTTREKEFLQ